MWQWLAGVMMATGQVVAIKKEKEGGWCSLRCDVVTYLTVDSNDGMCHCCLDDMAHLKGTIEVPHCLLHVLLTRQVLVVAVMVGVCVLRWVWAVDDSSGQWWP